MEINDTVISHTGIECKVTEIFKDGSHLMARYRPLKEHKNGDNYIVVCWTDPVEILEERQKSND